MTPTQGMHKRRDLMNMSMDLQRQPIFNFQTISGSPKSNNKLHNKSINGSIKAQLKTVAPFNSQKSRMSYVALKAQYGHESGMGLFASSSPVQRLETTGKCS